MTIHRIICPLWGESAHKGPVGFHVIAMIAWEEPSWKHRKTRVVIMPHLSLLIKTNSGATSDILIAKLSYSVSLGIHHFEPVFEISLYFSKLPESSCEIHFGICKCRPWLVVTFAGVDGINFFLSRESAYESELDHNGLMLKGHVALVGINTTVFEDEIPV